MNQEAVSFSNISASTAAFSLTLGGAYAVSVKGSNFGTVTLQKFGPDSTTWLDLKAAFDKPDGTGGTEEDLVIGAFAADGDKVFTLSPGKYRFTISSATAVYASIVRCPMA